MNAITAMPNAERPPWDDATEQDALELKVLSALGTLRFAPAPTQGTRDRDCCPPAGPFLYITDIPAPHVETVPGMSAVRTSRLRYISQRWYDVSFAVLILTSSAVALYRLIWMGQP